MAMRTCHQPWQDRTRGPRPQLRRAGDWQERPPRPLTPREREVWGLLSTGASRAAIARELGISYYTVRNHLDRIHEVLGVATNGEAIACWYGGVPYSQRHKEEAK